MHVRPVIMHGSGVLDMAAQIEKQALFFLTNHKQAEGSMVVESHRWRPEKWSKLYLPYNRSSSRLHIHIILSTEEQKKFHLDIATQIPSSFARRNPCCIRPHLCTQRFPLHTACWSVLAGRVYDLSVCVYQRVQNFPARYHHQ